MPPSRPAAPSPPNRPGRPPETTGHIADRQGHRRPTPPAPPLYRPSSTPNSEEPYCIVTTEVSAVSKRRANRKIPDVAAELNVQTCDPFQFIRRLDFSTSWVP
ncbi:DUF4411 family protein [Candidatus Palauibacter sp.]|uniref:DUF4411 family protein n=1 Tax=Candidatus Palauibacter sp. TaxID=3101350 RepID=UPI003B5BCE76